MTTALEYLAGPLRKELEKAPEGHENYIVDPPTAKLEASINHDLPYSSPDSFFSSHYIISDEKI